MATIILGMLPHYGHYNATFKTAKTLSERGHRVIYAGIDNAFREHIESQGFEFELLQMGDISAQPPIVSGSKIKQFIATYKHAKKQFNVLLSGDNLRELTDRLDPDLIVLDCTLGHYAIACHPRPVVFLSTSLFLGKDVNIPAPNARMIPTDSMLSRIKAEVSWWPYFIRRDIRELVSGWLGLGYYKQLKKIATQKNYPLTTMINQRRYYMPIVKLPEIVLTPKEYEFPRPDDSLVHFAGPAILEERQDLAFDWSPFDDTKPLAYCSLGSLSHLYKDHQSHFRRIMDIFAAKPDWNLLMTIGEHLDIKAFENVPSNVTLMNRVPQLEVLQKAALAIHHGGINSVKECIHFAVPMLMIAPLNDCIGSAARGHYHEVGISVPFDAPAQKISDAIEAVINEPRYKDKLLEMQAAFKQADITHCAADFIELYLHKELSEKSGTSEGTPREDQQVADKGSKQGQVI